MMGSRIAAAADAAGATLVRLDAPDELPAPEMVDLLLVDWSERAPSWGNALQKWCAAAPGGAVPRLVLFGPHTDLAAHADARAAGLGPMTARSKIVSDLPGLLEIA